jgi:hypothetical protein
MIQAGASLLNVRETYGVGLATIRARLKTRGLTMSKVRLQVPVPTRANNRRATISYAASADEERAVRAYAIEHGMTVSQVVRMALQTVGILDQKLPNQAEGETIEPDLTRPALHPTTGGSGA